MTGHGDERRGPQVLLASCDSLAQRQAWVDGPRAAERTLLAQVRVAVLLGRHVLLTYAQLFDGIVLLELGPRGLARALGVEPRELPVTISCPEGDVGLAIETVRAAGFERSAVEALVDRGRTRQHALARANVLQDEWADHTVRHRLAVAAPPPLPIRDFLERREPPARTTATPVGTAAVERARCSTSRSAMRSGLSTALEEGLSVQDAEALTRWWSRTYFACIAAQHGAAWIELVEPHEGSAPPAHGTVLVLRRVLDQLGAMPPAVFETVQYHLSQLGGSRGVVRDGQQSRRIAHVVMRASEPSDRDAERRSQTLRLVAYGALAILAAAVALPWGHGALAATVVAVGVTLLQGIPWDTVGELRRLRTAVSGAAVHLEEGEPA